MKKHLLNFLVKEEAIVFLKQFTDLVIDNNSKASKNFDHLLMVLNTLISNYQEVQKAKEVLASSESANSSLQSLKNFVDTLCELKIAIRESAASLILSKATLFSEGVRTDFDNYTLPNSTSIEIFSKYDSLLSSLQALYVSVNEMNFLPPVIALSDSLFLELGGVVEPKKVAKKHVNKKPSNKPPLTKIQ